MRTFKVSLLVLLLLTGPTWAQDIVLPAVPVIGVSPVLQWVMGVASILLSAVFSVGLLFLKQRLDVANQRDEIASTADRNAMIDRAIKRGALVSYGNQLSGASPAQAVADGLAYVKKSVPDSIGEIDQATDNHLSNAIAAEVVGLNATAPAVTSLGGAYVSPPALMQQNVPIVSAKGP